MNLADIRRKAQQEALSRQQQPMPAQVVSASPEPRAGTVALPAVEMLPEAETPSTPTPPVEPLSPVPAAGGGIPPDAEAIALAPAAPVLPGHRFDPLAVILAGREAATLDEDVPEVAGQAAVALQLEASEEFLCFRVADEKYAISIMAIKEIIRPREATEVPRMPRFVNGIISLRGIIVPIFDMHRRLELASGEPTGKERIVIVRHGDGFCGVLVDEVIQVVRLGSTAIEPPPAVLEGIDREFVAGLGRHGDAMLILLNLPKILDLTLR